MHPEPTALRLEHIGGPTALIHVDGLTLLTDPTFDPAGTDYPVRPAVVLHKHAGPAIAPLDLPPLDAVLLSHDQHADNLDNLGRHLLHSVPRTFTTVAAAARLSSPSTGLEPWQSATLPTPNGNLLRITATPARHGPAGIEPVAGDVIGFLLTLERPATPPEDLLYVTGDTVFYHGVAEVARRFRPARILLFAGAARTRGPMHLTMDVNDAIETAATFPWATLTPIHTEGWAHFSESAEDLRLSFEALGLPARLAFAPRPAAAC